MRYLSVCSGIEAASVAFRPLSWEPAAFAEIEPFPSAVLAHHYPDVPNLGDDLLVGGTPCQSFSVAGLRGGLADHRGNLALTFCEIADHFDPPWVLWENVPGVLSAKDNAFGCFLAGLSGAGEPLVSERGWDNAGLVAGPKRTVAWRVLNAQVHGVAQRRRRVFVLAARGSGNWASARALFPVGEGMHWHSAPRRAAREEAARDAAPSAFGGNRTSGPIEVSPALLAQPGSGWKGDFESETFLAFPGNLSGTQCASTENLAPAMGAKNPTALAFTQNQRDEVRTLEVAGALAAEPGMKQQTYLHQAMQVRRLTPVECERLQGFPDNYTAIPWRGKPASECPDGPRYRALGNSWAVPVARAIGQRIDSVQRGYL